MYQIVENPIHDPSLDNDVKDFAARYRRILTKLVQYLADRDDIPSPNHAAIMVLWNYKHHKYNGYHIKQALKVH